MKIIAGLFAGSSWERQSYMYDTFVQDLTWLVVLGLATALPPLLVYMGPALKPLLEGLGLEPLPKRPAPSPPSDKQPDPLRDGYKFCPFCAQQILSRATYCKYCDKTIGK